MENQENQEKKHKRRVRYSGTHPRNYKEKYKELNPEKYADTISKVIQKGGTPAGMHISICVQEILDFFDIQPGQQGLDATLGYGGHTSKMLEKLQGEGHIYGLDVDPIESAKTKKRLEEKGFGSDILTVKLENFANIDKVAREELAGMLVENADEPYAEEIAEAVTEKIRKGGKIETTTGLHQVIGEALVFIPEKERKEAIRKSSQRVFQALRIDVNHEFEVLYDFLDKLPGVLKPGGIVAILTFHSGEDRLVKKSFKQWKKEGLYSEIAKDVIRPSKEECFRNSRAKCTKMRWAIRSEE